MPPPCTKTGRGYAHTKQFTKGKLGVASGVHILLLTNLPLFPPLFYLKEMVEVAQHTLEMPPTPRWKSLCRWAQTQWWKSTRDDPKPLSAKSGNLFRDSPNPRVEMVEITSKMVPNPLMEITSEMVPNPIVEISSMTVFNHRVKMVILIDGP